MKIFKTTLTLFLAASTLTLNAKSLSIEPTVCVSDATSYTDQRPAAEKRLFRSEAVEQVIKQMQQRLKNPKLAWMFSNCFPNTLDTTVHFSKDSGGRPDTFVYTGDIHAMWLRDSGAQVWPYVQLANQDEHLKEMVAGVINRQFTCINIDPFANAFNMEAIPGGGEWKSDMTDMKDELHERKWEIDSLCYPIRLAYEYWKVTGDASVFDEAWLQAVQNILKTFRDQQRKGDKGSYRFMRRTERQFDTMSNDGWGAPVKPVGLIASAFRPSDDATVFLFLVPSNFFAVNVLRKAAEILTSVNKRADLALQCTSLADEVELALNEHLSRKVTVQGNRKKGVLQIEFYGEEDLAELIKRFGE